MSAEPRASDVAAMRAAIFRTSRVKIPGDDVWTLWSTAVQRLAGTPDQLQLLIRCLEILSVDRVVELPTNPASRMTVTRLPRYVTVPSARRNRRIHPWKTYPWVRRLGWVSSLTTVADELFDDLVAVNEWLAGVDGREVPLVPVRYRSADIFGREKRLDELAKTRLFGDGKLDFDLLACRRLAPPLAAATVGAGPDALVVENSDTYWVVLNALRSVDAHHIGVVAWGSGRTFPLQVESLAVDVAGRGPVRGTTWYWGDYDPIGVDIAMAASRVSDVVAVRPAVELWAAMADVDAQGLGEYEWSGSDGAAWLGDELWTSLSPVRELQGRVAQERVSVDTVSRWARRGGRL